MNTQNKLRLFRDFPSLISFFVAFLQYFSANGEKTITTYDPEMAFQIRLRPDLSFYDVYTVHQLYNCAGKPIYTIALFVCTAVLSCMLTPVSRLHPNPILIIIDLVF